jgi:hypothetical protein
MEERMRIRAIALLTVFLPAATGWAGDPWKEKSYKEWNEKEAFRVCNDSPWAKVVSVNAPWKAKERNTGARGPYPEQGSGNRGGYGEKGGPGERPTGPGPEGSQAQGSAAAFQIRWTSAKTMRQALGRLLVLRAGRQESEVEQLFAQQAPDYELAFSGPDMTPFQQSDEMHLKQKAYLRPKKSKQKLSPSRVEIQRAEDGKTVRQVIFYFAKKTDAGEPVITPDEKGVEFALQVGLLELKVSYEPHKMAAKEGQDL